MDEAKKKENKIKLFCQNVGLNTKLSMALMGLGSIRLGQIGRGICYLLIEVLFILYMIFWGGHDFVGFFTLGTKVSDPWLNISGDNSVIFMLRGIIAIGIICIFILCYIENIKDCYHNEARLKASHKIPTFKDDLNSLFGKNFYKLAIFIPLIGVLAFNVLPIIFMIFIAFTNYGGDIVPPKLVDWVGFANFVKIFSIGNVGSTFFKIFGWNILWAVMSTCVNYFLGLGLALLLNKKCVKGKAFWRSFPVLAYAVPGFITLLAFKFMFSYGGPINYYIDLLGGKKIGFLDIDSKWVARFIGLGVNAWLNVPTSMLLATGLLSNLDKSMYEAAEIDGASKFCQFRKLTLPFIIFATTPTLISQFVGNFNNFGIFYFLRDGITSKDYFLASNTDLLINWLYNLSLGSTIKYYGIAGAVSLIIFIFTSVISLTVYVRSNAYKKEDTYR